MEGRLPWWGAWRDPFLRSQWNEGFGRNVGQFRGRMGLRRGREREQVSGARVPGPVSAPFIGIPVLCP